MAGAHVDDGELQCFAHLLRRQADAGGRVHGLEHVLDQLLQGRGHPPDARALLAQNRMAVFDDGQYHCRKCVTGVP